MAAANQSIAAAADSAINEEAQGYFEVTRRQVSAFQGHLTQAVNQSKKTREFLTSVLNPGVDAAGARIPSNDVEANHLASSLRLDLDKQRQAEDRLATNFTNYCLTVSPDDPQGDATQATRTSYNDAMQRATTERSECIKILTKVPNLPASTQSTPTTTSSTSTNVNNNTSSDKSTKPVMELKPKICLKLNPTTQQVKDFIKAWVPYHESGVAKSTPAQQRVYLSNCMAPALWEQLEALDPTPTLPIDPANLSSGIFRELIRLAGDVDGGLLHKRCEWSRLRQISIGGRFEPFPAMHTRMLHLAQEAEVSKMSYDDHLMLRTVQMVEDQRLLKEIFKLKDPKYQDVLTCGTNFHHAQLALARHNEASQKLTTQVTASNVKSAPEARPLEAKNCEACFIAFTPERTPKENFCNSCKLDYQRTEPVKLNNLKCEKCNTSGNHTTAACKGRPVRPFISNRTERGRGRGFRRGRGSGRGRGRTRSPGDQLGQSRQRSSSGGRRSPSIYSKRFGANNISTERVVEEGVPTPCGFYGIKIEEVSIKLSANDLSTNVNNIGESILVPGRIRIRHKPWVRKARMLKFRSARHRRKLQKATNAKATGPSASASISRFFQTLLQPLFLLVSMTVSAFSHKYATLLRKQVMYHCNSITIREAGEAAASVMLIGDEIELEEIPKQRSTQFQKNAMWPPATQVANFDHKLDNLHVMVGDAKKEANLSRRWVASAAACPDTGASMSVCGPDMVDKLRLTMLDDAGKYKITAANGTDMQHLGTVLVRVRLENQAHDLRVLVTPCMKGRFIIGRSDLEKFRIIGPNFPAPIPDSAWNILENQ